MQTEYNFFPKNLEVSYASLEWECPGINGKPFTFCVDAYSSELLSFMCEMHVPCIAVFPFSVTENISANAQAQNAESRSRFLNEITEAGYKILMAAPNNNSENSQDVAVLGLSAFAAVPLAKQYGLKTFAYAELEAVPYVVVANSVITPDDPLYQQAMPADPFAEPSSDRAACENFVSWAVCHAESLMIVRSTKAQALVQKSLDLSAIRRALTLQARIGTVLNPGSHFYPAFGSNMSLRVGPLPLFLRSLQRFQATDFLFTSGAVVRCDLPCLQFLVGDVYARGGWGRWVPPRYNIATDSRKLALLGRTDFAPHGDVAATVFAEHPWCAGFHYIPRGFTRMCLEWASQPSAESRAAALPAITQRLQ